MRFLHLRLLVSSLSVCLSAALTSGAHAGQKVDIYRTDTLVKSQSERERNAAARTTFGQLIVRVSGQTSALDHPAIQAALPKAQNYLFGFSYKSSAERIVIDGKTFPAVGLQLNYEPLAIEQLLRESQLPLWPAVRPKVLVWLVAKDATGLRLVPELTDLQAMQLQAEYRGLPLVFPKLDLEDTLSLSANDLWELNREKIAAASLRYKADAILVGRYTPSSMGDIPLPPTTIPDKQIDDLIDAADAASSTASASVATSSSLAGDDLFAAELVRGPWMGDWQLLHEASDQSFADETPEVKGLFVAAIDHAADYFAHQYAIMPTNQGPQTIVLHVGNITSFGAFKKVQAYLGELAMVQRMEVMQVNAEGLRVRLTTEGDVRLLMSTLALGRRLAPLQSDSLTDPLAPTPVVAPADDHPSPSSDVAITDGIDADAMAELDQALANEQNPAIAPEAQAPEAPPVYGGTVENPLMYVWQK